MHSIPPFVLHWQKVKFPCTWRLTTASMQSICMFHSGNGYNTLVLVETFLILVIINCYIRANFSDDDLNQVVCSRKMWLVAMHIRVDSKNIFKRTTITYIVFLHVYVCTLQDYMHNACSEQVICQLVLLQKSMIIIQFKWYALQQGIRGQLFCTEKLLATLRAFR